MLHNVDGGWERSEPIELVYKKLPLSNVLAVADSHEVFNKMTGLEIVPSD
jgi:hypothetical protein